VNVQRARQFVLGKIYSGKLVEIVYSRYRCDFVVIGGQRCQFCKSAEIGKCGKLIVVYGQCGQRFKIMNAVYRCYDVVV
jgi:hypothetical protein